MNDILYIVSHKTAGGLLLNRGGDSMTEIALTGLIIAILGLLVDVVSLCYTIISNNKQ